MKDIFKQLFLKTIRFCIAWSLIVLLYTGCQNKNETLVLRWEGDRAVSVAFNPGSRSEFGDLSNALVEVRLMGQKDAPSMLGEVTLYGQSIVFSPLIPFTQGLDYEVKVNGNFAGTFHVRAQNASNKPSILAIYPTADTLPENLLKVYIHFSQPMREGLSQKYVHLLNGKDTVRGAFLDLTPELWNEARTVLTLWLDPGRIKRKLKPNLQLGAPLESSRRYRISISPEWQDQRLSPLSTAWERAFVTNRRDSLSPVPNNWSIITPQPGSSNPLTIAFGESLDHELLLETFFIYDPKGNPVKGNWKTGARERSIAFTPSIKWNPGTYTIKVLTKLEDLAGNNLNRPFERDLDTKTPKSTERHYLEIPFNVTHDDPN